MRTIKIKKAALSFRTLVVDYEESINEGGSVVTNLYKVNKGTLCHEDLIHAFNRLKFHFATLCDFKEVSGLDGMIITPEHYDFGDSLEKVFISGIQISYTMDHETLTIMGGKSVPKGRCINLSSPGVSDSDTEYNYVSDLFEVLENIRAEINAYLFDAKCAVKQAEIDFEAAEEEYAADSKGNAVSEGDEEPKPDRKGKGRGRKSKDVDVYENNLAS